MAGILYVAKKRSGPWHRVVSCGDPTGPRGVGTVTALTVCSRQGVWPFWVSGLSRSGRPEGYDPMSSVCKHCRQWGGKQRNA